MTSAASATTFVVNTVEYPNLLNIDLIGTVAGVTYNGEQGGGPIFLTGQTDGVGPVQTLLVYCDDIPHHISGGTGQNIVYNETSITTDNSGASPASSAILGASVVDNMEGLGKLGYAAYEAGDTTDAAVIQGAIWIEEYNNPANSSDLSSSTYDSYGATEDAILNGRLDYYLGLTFAAPNPAVPQLLNTDAQGQIDVQGQIAAGAVPEPAAWATMTLGFFGLGGLVRPRRSLIAA